jgi:hypothetical protein
MRFKKFFLIVALFSISVSTNLKAQTAEPKGKTQLIEFSNSSAKFTVPEGKTWYISNVFSIYKISKENLSFVIYMKSINGTELTNVSEAQLGPKLFDSRDGESGYTLPPTIKFPLILPQNTVFELVICQSKNLVFKAVLSDRKAYLIYTEIDN